MKYFLCIALFTVVSFSSFSQENEVITTYYFIRHAEKDQTDANNKNPHLTDAGLKRAEHWSTILGNIHFDAVYSTDYYRTMETAIPTASKNTLEITTYDPRNLNNIDDFLKTTHGKTVLVVGHSNTTPAFVNAILKQNKYGNIDETNNSNLYIVTLIGDKIADQVLTIN